MGAILLSAAFALLLAIPAVRAAQAEPPPTGIYIYAISRDGSPIGQQRMEFVNDGEKLRVISHTQLDVTLLGMTLYGFSQQSEEVHAAEKMLSYNSEANDDGKDRKVSLTLEGDHLKGIYNGDTERELDPTLPTSLFWQKPGIGDSHVIDALTGKERDITMTEIGPETMILPVGKVEARHYRITGDLKRELWYDANGILVAGERSGPDGSKVRLELQQRP